MKNYSIIKTMALIIGCIGISLAMVQCKKVGVNASNTDRSFTGVADSTLFSPFYNVTNISVSDVPAQINDSIVTIGVLGIIQNHCGSSTCHGGNVEPSLASYADVMKLVSPGNPEASKLWQLVTTNDLNKAMPPVTANELTTTDKSTIYQWIGNGAKEYPDLSDFRPAAIRIITTGCTSGNCHSVTASTGSWARAGLIPNLNSSDTSSFVLVKSNGTTYYCQLTNPGLRNSVWNSYKDSVRKFYSDTAAFASFRPYKTFSTPVTKASVRGSLSSYDDILMDIIYPKSARSNTSVQYTDTSGNKFYAKGNYLNVTSSLISRIDTTILLANPYTGTFAASNQGDMAYSDGGLTPSQIATVKAWYFADPNIPDQWKYGPNSTGIFKMKSGSVIAKH